MLPSVHAGAITQALRAYDLAPPVRVELPAQQGVNNLGVLVHTARETLRCKVYTPTHPAAALQYEHRLLLDLAARGCSFALPIPRRARDGTTLQPSALGWLALLPDLPGTTMNPVDPTQVYALGAALGELHHTLARLPQIARPGRALFSAFFAFPPPERDPLQLRPAMIGARHTRAADDLLAWWRAAAAGMAEFAAGAYRQLPAQLCHNDAAPYNILAQGGRVTAVLDFEFAGLAPRAFDLAMALRMTMRAWENPDPWDPARRLCQGYRRWMRLSAHECAQLPALFRLRSAMGILWALGRAEPLDAERLLLNLGYLRAASAWLDHAGDRLAALVADELA
jgi:Ser/Thr protein kinase RdoA (MazF antagonist)